MADNGLLDQPWPPAIERIPGVAGRGTRLGNSLTKEQAMLASSETEGDIRSGQLMEQSWTKKRVTAAVGGLQLPRC